MTPNERYQRLIDIQGELKNAQGVLEECQRTEDDVHRQGEIARGNTEAARNRLAALHNECLRLGDEAQHDFHSLVPPKEAVSAGRDDAPTWGERLNANLDQLSAMLPAANANGHAKVADSELPQF